MDHVRRSRDAYGGSAELYHEVIGSRISDRIEPAEDIELLDAFVRSVDTGRAPALDAGCGPGRIARRFADRGRAVVGVDMATGMIRIARREHPDLPFLVGELAHLPLPTAGFAAAVSWYSIITTPAEHLEPVFVELRRVLVDGGRLLVAFQAGEGERVERPQAYGTDVDLTLLRHAPDEVARRLRSAGFRIDRVVVREATASHESVPQAFVSAQRE